MQPERKRIGLEPLLDRERMLPEEIAFVDMGLRLRPIVQHFRASPRWACMTLFVSILFVGLVAPSLCRTVRGDVRVHSQTSPMRDSKNRLACVEH